MVVAPHADDAELGCGGYMHRVAADGGKVHVSVLAVGNVFFGHLGREVTWQERVQELRRSMDQVGGSCRIGFYDKDRLLDTLPIADIVSFVEDEIRTVDPTEILIPLPSSHQDHEIAYRACLAATRPSALTRGVQLIAAYEYPATAWGAGSSADAGKGGMYVEIGETGLDAKIAMLGCYRTQIRQNGHCWSFEAARAMARMRGLESGLGYAELFHVLRKMVR